MNTTKFDHMVEQVAWKYVYHHVFHITCTRCGHRATLGHPKLQVFYAPYQLRRFSCTACTARWARVECEFRWGPAPWLKPLPKRPPFGF